jgi:hypothetical protein
MQSCDGSRRYHAAYAHATLTRASSLGATGFTVTAEISEMGSCVAHGCVRKTQSESESEREG